MGDTFGFFPNRNQTGNLIALGGLCMLALAFLVFSGKNKVHMSGFQGIRRHRGRYSVFGILNDGKPAPHLDRGKTR